LTRLVVVSNRVSVPSKSGTLKGGLAVSLRDALTRYESIWFGWDGCIGSANNGRLNRATRGNTTYYTVPLTRQDYDQYYRGYSNQVLWPLCHERLNLIHYQRTYETGYRRVNSLLSSRLNKLLHDDDLIWVHDYHLIPMAHYLREMDCRAPIGFFLHIPFPPYDVFRALPNHERLLREMCCYDLLGFQTEIDRRAFLDCVRQTLPDYKLVNGGSIRVGKRTLRTGAFPISVDVEDVRSEASRGRTSGAGKRLERSLLGRKLIIGADRIDYSKGLGGRLRAYECMLRRYPSFHRNVVMLQVGQPSRDDVPEYQEIQRDLAATAGEVNSTFAEFDWIPLRYVAKGLARSTILGFLSIGAAGLVTPLRDGMNLVAKEFVAAQDPDDPGVLVLSELTGAARELREALLVNPYDQDGVADALAQAITMPSKERKERWESLLKTISGNDIHNWCRGFLKELRAARKLQKAA
jgi:trehalose 6-phosphate synthase